MSHQKPRLGGTSWYEIRIKGRMSDRWSDWFEGMTLVHEQDGTTVIRGRDLDQAALHGLLTKVRDLGLPLISVATTSVSDDHTPRSSQE